MLIFATAPTTITMKLQIFTALSTVSRYIRVSIVEILWSAGNGKSIGRFRDDRNGFRTPQWAVAAVHSTVHGAFLEYNRPVLTLDGPVLANSARLSTNILL